MKIIVGTRGSKLALTQSQWVVEQLKKHNKDIDFELKIIKTKGDIIQNVALDKIGDKGLFTKEIEQQLLDKEIDLAIHSMKDMPSVLPEGLKFSYVPKREDARDVLILKEQYKSIDDLPKGAKIGTGSKRRKYQLLKYRPDLQIVPIRGNIDTRINKIETENLDGIVLAAAGVIRASMTEKISYYLPVDIMLPAPAQGALAIEVRENEEIIENIIKCLHDEITTKQVIAEREFLKQINGSCHIPIGAYCDIDGETLTLTGLFGDSDGNKVVKKSIQGTLGEEEKLGNDLAKQILKEFNEYEG